MFLLWSTKAMFRSKRLWPLVLPAMFLLRDLYFNKGGAQQALLLVLAVGVFVSFSRAAGPSRFVRGSGFVMCFWLEARAVSKVGC